MKLPDWLSPLPKMRSSGGNGHWGEPDFPKTGWTCVDMIDLGTPAQICGMCECREIRYVHVMEHPEGHHVEAGCVCAGHMENDEEGAREREKELQKAAKRKANTMQLGAAISAIRWVRDGNFFRSEIFERKITVKTIAKGTLFTVKVGRHATSNPHKSAARDIEDRIVHQLRNLGVIE